MSAATDTDGSGFKSQGAHSNTQNGKAQKSQVPAQQTPTQGHDRDMGTTPNTDALYLRKSSLDDRWLVIGLVDLGVGETSDGVTA